ncbi:UTP--glucose-1-phosphate uridylyltransferase [Astathelohania contejeani]|uniref:UTP--glucose-1-phosphate uridylyltransferase n=1 Tax=Astathelohania contejeani TaxID=164912 RepID=A0ABQ7I1H8_9MICR|nr:UTP--glucose-1-phosphate uridylyltransferase [Thelohania contejeani]
MYYKIEITMIDMEDKIQSISEDKTNGQHMIAPKEFLRKRSVKSLLTAMKGELSKLKKNKNYKKEHLDEFYKIFERYLKTRDTKIQWDKINPPTETKLIQYDTLPKNRIKDPQILLRKLAVVKLNGGLGTSMGCVGPKSAIQVREDDNFLDLVVKQIDHLHRTHETCVPLILMNSSNTQKETAKMICKYKGIRTFTQSIYPRISSSSLLPVSQELGNCSRYPPGHGDIYNSLKESGMLDKLLAEGKEYLFVSNIDNLAATVDLNILEYFATEELDFLMEVTDKTRADIKGGTLIEYEGDLRLLEIAQVPEDKKGDFTSVRKFKVFNTNSAWINLKKLKEILDSGGLTLEIIENRKQIPGTGEKVIQLETAMGAAIKFFPKSRGIVVPRTRFLPVKTCSDLFLVKSNLYLERHGCLFMNPKRLYPSIPLIKLLGENFKEISKFLRAFKGQADILELDHLTVSGNVRFGKGVVLKGTVIIIADKGNTIHIPDGSILEDNILSGNLPILEH